MKFLSRLLTALNLLPSIATLAFASSPISRQSSTKARILRAAPCRCPCGSRRWVCDQGRGAAAATSPRRCGQPHARAAGSTAPCKDSRRCRASGELMDGRTAGPLPRARPRRTLYSARSSASTNTSITRTALLSSTQSSRHSGNSDACARSAPATKPFINAPADSTARIIASLEFHTARVNSSPARRPGGTAEVPLIPDGIAAVPRTVSSCHRAVIPRTKPIPREAVESDGLGALWPTGPAHISCVRASLERRRMPLYWPTAQTLKAATGRCKPLSRNSPAGSIVASASTAACTLRSMRIWPSTASLHRRAARLTTVPIAA